MNKVDFHLDSLVAANVTQADKKVLKRSDGLPVPISQPTGGYGISMYHDGSPVVFSTSEGLSASDRALLDSIANTQYDTAALHSDLDTYTNKDAWKGTAGGGGGLDEPGMHTALDNYANKNAFKADVSALATTAQVSAIDTTVDLSALATTAQLAPLATSAEVAALDFTTDLTGIARTTDIDSAASTVIAAQTSASDTADAILNRNLAGGSNGGRTVKDALRANRNRVEVDPDSGTITVYAEDDTTVAWSGVVTTGDRDPINSVNPE